MKKYKLLENDKIKFDGTDLYRIKALIDIKNEKGKIVVKKGELGGYIESEEMLSHKGTCWIYDNSKVYGDVEIKGNSKIKNNSRIEGSNALVIENSKISNCDIYDGVFIKNSKLKNIIIFGGEKIENIIFELDKKYKKDYYLDTELHNFIKIENGIDEMIGIYLNNNSEKENGNLFIENEILTDKLKEIFIKNCNGDKYKEKMIKMNFNYLEAAVSLELEK